MERNSYAESIAHLAESEGVFTTAQAKRLGIPRDALHDAFSSGRVERIMHGVYRLVGSGASYTDELVALWKLTAPKQFTHERIQPGNWDGVTAGGATAASLLEIGDFHLSPYRVYAPRRINSRNPSASFARRIIQREDVTFLHGLLVTRPERTVSDLVVDDEDFSLVADVLRDASHKFPEFDYPKLLGFLEEFYGEKRTQEIYQQLLFDAGISAESSTR
ncbi:type IV toxin-antitoxin system AbiEi family antitoxin domain-containing protein [Arcanobacterium phocae]|uniref:type IV toxin-antitoxin system AbiEi family antitoxin domain-containing protein n=1 Tax=Arcanobacterium phocae TaxID=131112 RepID=UPI001C0EBE93|nr:type IV toxin-antitoxin system AbiEi family antitoxin domain-containing protein [Arcanobacterium phocae]